MKVNYTYATPSNCMREGGKTVLGLSTDLTRKEQVSFEGHLKHPLIFRDAMLMLRQIVTSDSSIKKKDRTDFFNWLNAEIDRRVMNQELYMKKERDNLNQQITLEITEREKKLDDIKKLNEIKSHLKKRVDEYDLWRDYNKIERDFWKFIKDKDYDLWFVLDPVITVHPDEVTFEAFSIDESIYGCLSIPMEEFELLNEPKLGTTNIDFSAKLAREMERFRTYTDVTLSINPDGFGVSNGVATEHLEKKIDLPESWIKGFSQVSSASFLNGAEVELSPADYYDICAFLRRHKAKTSPRYMKLILIPEQRVKIIFEPFKAELVLNSVYHGKKAREEKIWSRRRFLVAESLIPIAKSFKVRLLGFGMPQFIVADLGIMKMTIGLSAWSSNDWVKGTAFNIMSGFTGYGNYQDVYDLLKQKRALGIDDINTELGSDISTTTAGIGMLFRKGEGYYDIESQRVRFRRLCNFPLPEKLYESTEQEEYVLRYLKESMDGFEVVVSEYGEYTFSDSFTGKNSRNDEMKTSTKIIIDTEGQISKAICNCTEFNKSSRNISTPCPHILALYLISQKFMGLDFEPNKIYKINDIVTNLL